MPTCNNWSPAEGICEAPLTTAQELIDGCCAPCAKSIDEALARHLDALTERRPSFERRIAAEVGPDLADEAIEAAHRMLDEDPNIAW